MTKSKSIVSSLAGACFLLIVGWLMIHDYLGNTGSPERTIIIKYDFIVSNTSSRAIRNAGLHAAAPLSATPTQQCIQNKTNQPSREITDSSGNTHLEMHWDLIPPYTSKVVSVSSEVGVWKNPQPSGTAPSDHDSAPAPLIESDHAQIKALAGQLKGGGHLETARNIFAWVSENIRYAGYVKKNRGALYALKHRTGDCTEFTTLFVALCRAGGVPARCMGGFVASKSAALDLGDYHNWAEFFYQGRWHLADPQRKIFKDDGKASTYIAYKIIRPSEDSDGALLTRIRGAGVNVKANS